jgi:hypothetical protein
MNSFGKEISPPVPELAELPPKNPGIIKHLSLSYILYEF